LFEQHDLNRNGILERREALNLLKDLCSKKAQPQPSIPYFNRMFQEIDINNDGVLSKFETLLFVKNFLNFPIDEDEDVQIKVMQIFNKYDSNRNGCLEKRETLELLNEILADRGQLPATNQQFNRFFNDIDLNRDGVISKFEMYKFVKNFLGKPFSHKQQQ
jgi:Ca2+-binding EF-hand superfamily protein